VMSGDMVWWVGLAMEGDGGHVRWSKVTCIKTKGVCKTQHKNLTQLVLPPINHMICAVQKITHSNCTVSG